MSVTLADFKSDVNCNWCPGCGNFGILNAVKQTFVDLDIAPHQVIIASGIGQATKIPHYMQVNTFNGLHGREVATATGIRLAVRDLPVIVHAGEGGAYGEGGNHFLHSLRRNNDITLVVHDNYCYGLTKGQASPTTPEGVISPLNTKGVPAMPLNPLALAISQSCGFVAQCCSMPKDTLVDLLKQAIQHKGFSLLNVLQPCVTWDKVHTYKYYRENTASVPEDHDVSDQMKALELSLTQTDKHLVGVLFKQERSTFEDKVLAHIDKPLRERGTGLKKAEELFEQFC